MHHRPAHYQWHLSLTERVERNKRVFVDLVAMSRANHLHYSSVSRNGWTGYSGFVRLASRLSVETEVRDTWLGSRLSREQGSRHD
jgi:formylglycine-generating enzyme required for sulfatase activity